MEKIISILFIAILISSCKSRQQNEINSYRHLEGNLSEKSINLDLHFMDSLVNGSYYFDSDENPQQVSGYLRNDSLILESFSTNENDNILKFKGIWKQHEFVGRCNDSMSFKIMETYKNGSDKFTLIHSIDSVVDSTSHITISHAEFNSIEALGTSKDFIQQSIYHLFLDSLFHGTMQDFIQHTLDDYTPTDSMELDIMKQNPYDFTNNLEIIYNKNNRIILSASTYQYMGGAHGNTYTNFVSLDLINKKLITINDVLTPEEIAGLNLKFEHAFRNKYALNSTDSLNTILFDNAINFVNDNYYITEKGIGFLYNQYEIAAYAIGQITLYLTFDELKK